MPSGEAMVIKMLFCLLFFIVLSRWGDKSLDGRFGYAPLGGAMKAERRFDGYTIPSAISCGWWFGTDCYFEFFRAQIEKADFR
jgi:hypothetical protein